MKKQIATLIALLGLCVPAFGADISPQLTPSDGEKVSEITTVKVKFVGIDMISRTKVANLGGVTLTNTTTGKKYVCVDAAYSFSEMDAVTMKFGESTYKDPTTGAITGTPLTFSDPGSYTLTIPKGSFNSEYPVYTCPEITATYTIPTKFEVSVTYGDGQEAQLHATKEEAAANPLKVEVGTAFKVVAENAVQLKVNVTPDNAGGGTSTGWINQESHEWTITEAGTYEYTIAAYDGTNSAGGFLQVTVDQSTTMTKYTLSPTSGSTVTDLPSVSVTFPDTDWLWGTKVNEEKLGDITLTADNGTVYNAVKYDNMLDAQKVTLSFGYKEVGKEMTIVNPGKYTLHIPAGIISDWNDAEAVNDEITAAYTVSDGSNAIPMPEFAPAPGEVRSITDITLTFDEAVSNLTLSGETWKNICLTDYEDSGDITFKCTKAAVNGNVATLTFATEEKPIKTKAYYVLTIPAGALSATVDGTECTSTAMTGLYFVTPPTGPDDLVAYDFPGTSVGVHNMVWVESLQTIELRFPNAENGIQYPFGDLSVITLDYTPAADIEADPAIYKCTGAQYDVTNGYITLVFDYAKGAMEQYGIYKLTIPANTFAEQDNPNSKNRLIERTYRIASEDEVGLRLYYNQDGTGPLIKLYKTEEEAARNELHVIPDTTLWLYLDGARRLTISDSVTGETEQRSGNPCPVTVSKGSHRYELSGVATDANYTRYLYVEGDISDGIENAKSDAEPAIRYYDINGRQVEAPLTPGFYIEVKGSTVSKIMAR